MITVHFQKAKVAELDAELDLYRSIPGVEVAEAGTLTNADKRVAEIKRLIEEHGYAVSLTPEFMAANPELTAVLVAQGAAEGEIVLASEEDLSAANAQKAEEEKRNGLLAELKGRGVERSTDGTVAIDDLSTADLEMLLEAMDRPVPKAVTTPEVAKAQVDTPSGELVYLKKTVIGVDNRIMHGKSYVDVRVATGETFTMTKEEFIRDVKPRA